MWLQLVDPIMLLVNKQERSDVSVPEQPRPESKIRPVPCPKYALLYAVDVPVQDKQCMSKGIVFHSTAYQRIPVYGTQQLPHLCPMSGCIVFHSCCCSTSQLYHGYLKIHILQDEYLPIYNLNSRQNGKMKQ